MTGSSEWASVAAQLHREPAGQPRVVRLDVHAAKAAVGRRYRKAVRVVPRMLAMVVLLYALMLAAYFGKYRVRPRHHHAGPARGAAGGEIETSSARRLLCWRRRC